MDNAAIRLDALVKRFTPNSPPALDSLSALLPAGQLIGLVGPDGAGKTTLIRLLAGLMQPTEGRIALYGLDSVRDAARLQQLVSYMPQRFGLYEDLTVLENLKLYADLRDVTGNERKNTFERLLNFTDLKRFTRRKAGALSGGMKQKLGLACALIKTPRLLLLDEPSVGVDPVSRRDLWELVKSLLEQGRNERDLNQSEAMTVIWSTAYLDEAERCQTVLLLNEGQLIFTGPPDEMTRRVAGRTFQLRGVSVGVRQVLADMLNRDDVIDGVIQGQSIRLVMKADAPAPKPPEYLVGTANVEVVPVAPRFEDAFVDALGGGPGGHSALADLLKPVTLDRQDVVEAIHLTKQYGDFKAADDVTFTIRQGEIFGLLGPNGAGKSTTFKMMCGLARPTSGNARVTGISLLTASSKARANIGYMAQKFSLYGNMTVGQNLRFFSGVYGLTGKAQREMVDHIVGTFELAPFVDSKSGELPLGFKQRLALACAVMHNPAVLFLDEPTSGVDPVTRREFWTHINGLVQNGVTVMVTTHFMDEAEYCDRIGLVYRGRIIAMGSPDDLKAQARTADRPDPNMEDAFIALIDRFDQDNGNNRGEQAA